MSAFWRFFCMQNLKPNNRKIFVSPNSKCEVYNYPMIQPAYFFDYCNKNPDFTIELLAKLYKESKSSVKEMFSTKKNKYGRFKWNKWKSRWSIYSKFRKKVTKSHYPSWAKIFLSQGLLLNASNTIPPPSLLVLS